MTDEGKSQTRIDEMIELNKLRAQQKVEEDQSESAQLYFDKLIDPVLVGCDDLNELNKKMLKKKDIIKKAVVDDDENLNLSKDELIKLRDDLKKKNEKMADFIESMNDIFV